MTTVVTAEQMANPEWVNTQLRMRLIRPFVDGDNPQDAADVADVVRWAIRGGARRGDKLTAELVNRGRLIEILFFD